MLLTTCLPVGAVTVTTGMADATESAAAPLARKDVCMYPLKSS